MNQKFPHTHEGMKDMAEYFISNIKTRANFSSLKRKKKVPSTIFTAGAPGSGKTEFIESLPSKNHYVIIDIDIYRSCFEGYTGTNAPIFQTFSSRVAGRIYKFCLQENLNLIFDGTFGALKQVEQNISQCIKRERDITVYHIHQHPFKSYLYTKLREIDGTRCVPRAVFIEKYFNSLENTYQILNIFPRITIIWVIKVKSQKYTSDEITKEKSSYLKNLQNKINRIQLEKNLLKIEKIIEEENLGPLSRIKKIFAN